jgi:hypothetical protein
VISSVIKLAKPLALLKGGWKVGMVEKDDVRQVSEKAKDYFDQGFN